jgi:adenylate cyclase
VTAAGFDATRPPLSCPTCGTTLRATAKFCDECGSAVAISETPAEYKQVTVLFADVVHSMDIAAAVGAERWREIMSELVSAASAVVQRFNGTVDKFTGDGIMAVFGAPVALEDHAFRACLAALGIQDQVKRLTAEVAGRDGLNLQLRVGLNSGQVIAGEIGSGASGGYTAIGEQVGMAQRMESVAPPGGVMLSASTARLVEHTAVLAEAEMVQIKGTAQPVPARRLIATTREHRRRKDPRLVGRAWELSTLNGILNEVMGGAGCIVGVLGPPGIGKSRLVREAAVLASSRGVQVFSTYCESHTSDVPFHAVTGLLRVGLAIDDLDDAAARAEVRARMDGADPEDLLLLDDLLGIADPSTEPPNVEADARRRRLTTLVNMASRARGPALYVIEDAHWIDEVSESMLTDFLAVVPQTRSMVLITYRPEYRGALASVPGAQTIALRPLNTAQTETLLTELLGTDSSVYELTHVIAERAGGNPFFAEEIVRDLSERGAIRGAQGSYLLDGELTDLTVPATLQAAIAARVDRLSGAAKRTLSAAAVIGSRFSRGLISALGSEPVVEELIAGELIDQVASAPREEYAFRHPLIRTVAYESQLKSDRAELHRRLATAIEQREPEAADENAVLIAEHLRSAGDLRGAFDWHMRGGGWLIHRNITGARASWQHAGGIADQIPDSDPDSAAMRIAPRTLLCASAWLTGVSMADTGFDELRDLAAASGDKASLAMGMAGWLTALVTHSRFDEATRLASELTNLLESIGDPTLTLGLLYSAVAAKFEAGHMTEALGLAVRMVELADGDAERGSFILGSPLVAGIMLRGAARCFLGDRGWRDDVDRAATMARAFDPTLRVLALLYKYMLLSNGVWLPDEAALHETAEILEVAERSGDDLTLACARYVRGLALVAHDGSGHEDAFALLAAAREAAAKERFPLVITAVVDTWWADEQAHAGDLDAAVELSRAAVEQVYACGDMFIRGRAAATLVSVLLDRGAQADRREAQAVADRLAAVPTEPGFVMHDIWLLRMRALLARARGDDAGYRDHRDAYRAMANSLGFEGHIAWASVME